MFHPLVTANTRIFYIVTPHSRKTKKVGIIVRFERKRNRKI